MVLYLVLNSIISVLYLLLQNLNVCLQTFDDLAHFDSICPKLLNFIFKVINIFIQSVELGKAKRKFVTINWTVLAVFAQMSI